MGYGGLLICLGIFTLVRGRRVSISHDMEWAFHEVSIVSRWVVHDFAGAQGVGIGVLFKIYSVI